MTGHLRKETDEEKGGIISPRLWSQKLMISSQKIEAANVKIAAETLQSRPVLENWRLMRKITAACMGFFFCLDSRDWPEFV